MKRCSKCNWKLPLWLFSKNPKKYQNPTNKGRNYVCKICNYKFWTFYGYAWLWDDATRRYKKVEFPTKKDVIKHILLK